MKFAKPWQFTLFQVMLSYLCRTFVANLRLLRCSRCDSDKETSRLQLLLKESLQSLASDSISMLVPASKMSIQPSSDVASDAQDLTGHSLGDTGRPPKIKHGIQKTQKNVVDQWRNTRLGRSLHLFLHMSSLSKPHFEFVLKRSQGLWFWQMR